MTRIDRADKAFAATGDPRHLDVAIDEGLALLDDHHLRDQQPLRAAMAWEVGRTVRTRIDLRLRNLIGLAGPAPVDLDPQAWDPAGRAAVAADVDLFIRLMRLPVAGLPEHSAYRDSVRIDLADGHTRRYQLTRAPDELDTGIRLYREALELSQGPDHNLVICLLGLADLHQERYGWHRDPADLAAAVTHAEQALRLPGLSEPHRLEVTGILADALVEQVEQGAVPDDARLSTIDTAIGHYEDLLSRPVADDVSQELPRLRTNLAYARRLRYRLGGDPADLDRQIDLLTDALAGTDAGAGPGERVG
ncbi:hypothetical protein O7623_09120 [Solwaraspora sp. WMMD791]|uniref:hypothetical protein n=1 Tax=Solwaraspora sp. WMMD791 TaxID=3016086 RepID=UPI00249B2145|nr:hypothetical protein [Solwaraspora sp. WMMD791]WFE29331.1 hypothetical protein O7623_09120 [Solwaraspora sp. WMMD791]